MLKTDNHNTKVPNVMAVMVKMMSIMMMMMRIHLRETGPRAPSRLAGPITSPEVTRPCLQKGKRWPCAASIFHRGSMMCVMVKM